MVACPSTRVEGVPALIRSLDARRGTTALPGTGQARITDHFESDRCVHCGRRAGAARVCGACAAQPDALALEHVLRSRGLEQRERALAARIATAGL